MPAHVSVVVIWFWQASKSKDFWRPSQYCRKPARWSAQQWNRGAAFCIPSPGFDPELLRSLDPEDDDGASGDYGENDDGENDGGDYGENDDGENDGDGEIPGEDSKEPQQRLKLSARAAEEGSPDDHHSNHDDHYHHSDYDDHYFWCFIK